MLVINRKKNDRIEITTKTGEKIIVIIKKIGQSYVKLGFECDRDIKISRIEEEIESKEEGFNR